MSVHYSFPKIENISDVLPHIAGKHDFSVLKKDGDVTCIQYNLIQSDTFPSVSDVGSAILRECRGIKFCSVTGKILSRPFQKFFNFGERQDMDYDLDQRHVILEKLDGSMVCPVVVNGESIRWMTKRGITDASMQCEKFVAEHHLYTHFVTRMIHFGLTPIFEWCSDQNRIVLSHKTDRLVLLAVRDTISGAYMPFDEMSSVAHDMGIDCVKAVYTSYASTPGKVDIAALSAIVKSAEGEEGVVVRWDDGHMVKMKSDWYVLRHRAKDGIQRIRPLTELILKEGLDDILPLLDEDDKNTVVGIRDKIANDIHVFSAGVHDELDTIRERKYTRKEFGLNDSVNKAKKSAVFALWDSDGKFATIEAWVVNFVLHHCSNNRQFSKLEYILPNVMEHFKRKDLLYASDE